MYNRIELHNIFTTNYTEYAKYTITDRAIPSLEDGCKNIHRRILWSMYVNKNTYDKNRVKANTAVGLCMGYSPHGNTSIYDAMVRFANDSINLNLIDGKGAFSSKTSRDVQAGADRYVEVRLSPVTQEYLKDIDKNLSGMKNNYDNTKLEPILLPVTFPTILANPNLGIATGIACNICAFPVQELIDNTINIIDGKEPILMIPDFSTGAELIYNEDTLKQIQNTGTGKLILRSKYEFKDDSIIITEIPYTTTREAIIEKIIDLVKEGKLKEITDINDHTGKDGLKITIDTKKNTNKERLIQLLFKKTPLQDTFSCNFNVLDKGIPKTLGTKDIISKWLEFRKDCIQTRIKKDIELKSDKLHILVGLKNVLLDIDKAVEIIRFNLNPQKDLVEYFKIDEKQAEYILNIKLKNINKNYITKQIKDIDNLESEVIFLKNNINNIDYINDIIKEDLQRVKKLYSYDRKTNVLYGISNILNNKELEIEQYKCRVFYTNNYIKKHLKQSDNHKHKEDDIILGEFTTTNKSTLLIFTDKGNRYKVAVNDLATHTPSAYGDYIYNLIDIDKEEKVIKVVSIENPTGYMYFVYENGKVAKVNIDGYMSANKKLQNCYNLDSKLIDIYYSEKDIDILLCSSEGKALIVNTDRINAKGSRATQGVTTMKLDDNIVIGCIMDIKRDCHFTIKTQKDKTKEFILDDIAPTGKSNEERTIYQYIQGRCGNTGNFLINTRPNNDRIISLIN